MHFSDISLSKNTVILGVGNPARGDDGVGVYVSETLISMGVKRVVTCYEVPENYTVKICGLNPDIVLIIDAVNMHRSPGDVELLDPDIVSQGITTHNAGLDIIADFIRYSCSAKIYLLAVQPAKLDGEMSHKVRKAAEEIVKIIVTSLNTTGQN